MVLDAELLVVVEAALLEPGSTRFGVVRLNDVVHPYAACPHVSDGGETYPPARGSLDVASLREVVETACATCHRLMVANPSWLNSVLQPVVLAHRAEGLDEGVDCDEKRAAWGAFLRQCVHHPSGTITLGGIESLLERSPLVSTDIPQRILGGRRTGVGIDQAFKLMNGAWHEPRGCSLVWGDELDGFSVLAESATSTDVASFAALWRCYETNGERRALEQVWELSRAVSTP